MAGSISLSLSQQFDSLGAPLSGGKLYFYQAGTTATPQSAYQDTGLTIPYPNPITLDSAGRVPQFYLADGQIKIRLTDANGVTQVSADNILVVGPSSGGGGGGGVDPTTIVQTGQVVCWYGTGSQTGFVRCNGRSIGGVSSGATERANADTAVLFTFLWTQDVNLAVSGGRGASSAADFAANKTIVLPDFRGRVMAGLGDMGNADAGLLTPAYFGASGTTLGANGGAQNIVLTLPQLPSGITSTASPSLSVSTTLNNFVASNSGDGTLVSGSGSGVTANVSINVGPVVSKLGATGTATGTVSSISNNTSSQPHRTVQPTILLTTYMKL